MAEILYEQHHDELSLLNGVTPHLGDSREVLPSIVKDLKDHNVVYWLDGHWSGSETAGKENECPLLDELSCLSKRTEDIILIDDARLFISPPPYPSKPEQWPTIQDIVTIISNFDKVPFLQIIDDVIFIIPDKQELRSMLINYAQQRSTILWETFLKIQKQNTQPHS